MYARLVATSNLGTINSVIKDIVTLVTSAFPTIGSLSAFNNTSSAVIDATQARWTYVGSNIVAEQTGLIAGGGPTLSTTSGYNYCISSPCLSTGLTKYAILSSVSTQAENASNGFVLTGAQSVTSAGIATNEGPRYYAPAASVGYLGYYTNYMFQPTQGSIFHLIANPRHITIIKENVGIIGVWETSNTSAHTYFNTAPFIQYTHAVSNVTDSGLTVPTAVASQSALVSGSFSATAFGTTNISTGIYNGTVSVASIASASNQYLASAGITLNNTIDINGNPLYQINPVFFRDVTRGYATQNITGIVPIYFTKPGMGNSGDNVYVNGINYKYFNSGAGYGVIMTTG